MRLDSLLPVILIACLIALAYFLTKAMQAAQQNDDPAPPPIQLDQDDYGRDTNEDEVGVAANTNLSNEDAGSAAGSATTTTTDGDNEQDYYEAGRDETPATNDYQPRAGSSYTPTEDTSEPDGEDNRAGTTTTSGGTAAAQRNSGGNQGNYLVIAGSYRERINADNQMRRLHRAGFANAQVALFDRGTYALVVADRFSTHSRAEDLRGRLRAAGFDAYIDDRAQ